MSNARSASVLAALYAVLWACLAVDPYDRHAWTVQNAALLAAVAGLVLTRRRFELSRLSYALVFAFLVLATIGAHYTYPHTPYDAWFEAITGRSLDELCGWRRNQYDRFVHFAYGFLLVVPVRELFLRVVGVRGFLGYALPLDVVMSTSMVFELVEWCTAVVFAHGDPQYIGMQGDAWDSHKDMALATLGAFLALCATAIVNARRQRASAGKRSR